VPWLVSNPIHVRPRRTEPAAASAPAPDSTEATTALFADGQPTSAVTEQGGQARAALDVVAAAPAGEQLLFRFAVGGRVSENPYAALVFPVTALQQYRQVTFTARADAPMRVAIPLRAPGNGTAGDGERWRRSVYLDSTPRTISLPFADFRGVPGARAGQAPLAEVNSLLFVVDLVHTPLGGSGSVWLDDVRLDP
jgi:hypothetical protein